MWLGVVCSAPRQNHGQQAGTTEGRQTVPRSETQALLSFLLATTGPAAVHIDCQPVLTKAIQLQRGTWTPDAKTVNGDLWELIRRRLGSRPGELSFHKIKAHLTQEEAMAAGYTAIAWELNGHADQLANEMADRAMVPLHIINKVKQQDQKTDLVLQRLMAINEVLVQHSRAHPHEKLPKQAKVPRREQIKQVGLANNHKLRFGRDIKCQKCELSSSYKAATRVFSTTCTGATYGPGHDVRNIHGLKICWKCGALTAVGKLKAILSRLA